MTDIQIELQHLSENFSHLDSGDSDLNKKKQLISIKSEKLKKEFGKILSELQFKKKLTVHTIPSDDVISKIYLKRKYFLFMNRNK